MKKISNWPFTVGAQKPSPTPSKTQPTFDNSSSLRGSAYAHKKEGCNSAPKASDELSPEFVDLGSKPTQAGFDGSAAPSHIAFQGVSA